ncbi:MAG: hypothetical protein H8E25_10225 [Planctomycetes bacterium]|nr:hypothetical protein [Planctomycetota bacterium]
MTIKALVDALKQQFKPHHGLAVAVSGGVDSSLLLAAACDYYGAQNCLAVIAVSPSLADQSLADARKLCADLKVELIELATNELENKYYIANKGDRCFWCKQELFMQALPIAVARNLPLAYGENYDDMAHERAGRISAEQNKILAPLRDASFSKNDVRRYARALKLSVADKPAAPCLASRIAVGQAVSLESLEVVAIIEQQLRGKGYQVFRARIIGSNKVSFEFDENELPRAIAESKSIAKLATAQGMVADEITTYCSGSVA